MNTRSRVMVSLFVLSLVSGCGGPTGAETATPSPHQSPLASGTLAPSTPTVRPTSTEPLPTATLAPLSGVGGGRIVFASKRDENYDIYVMNADGSDQRRLTYHLAEDSDPSFSPDGTRIAFPSNRTGRFEIYVMNVDGSNLRQLTHDGGWGPAWSPDGSMIAFTRHDPYGAIYIMNADGSNQRQVTPFSLEVGISGLDWSPDGMQMLCVIDASQGSIDTIYRDLTINVVDISGFLLGTGEVTFRALPRVSESMNDRPTWSPDGSQIAFSALVGQHRDIYIINYDGTNLWRLTMDDHYDEFCPSWSPDGTRIAYQGSVAGGWDIYTIKVDGTDLQRLTTDFANDVAPSWVP